MMDKSRTNTTPPSILKMTIIEGWMPPTRENYELILTIWQISYPIVSTPESYEEQI